MMVDVIYGTDIYLVKETIAQLEASLKDVDDFVRFSSSDRGFELDRVIEACHTISLFGSRKCVTLLIDQEKDLAKIDEAQLIDLIEKPNYDVNLIIWLIKKPLAKTKLKKTIDKFAKLTDVKGLSASDFDKRLNNKIKGSNVQFDGLAKNEFSKRLGGNLLRIDRELEKFAVLDRTITMDDVQSLVSPVLEDNIFEFNKALVARNSKRAFSIYQGFLEMKMDPLALLGMVAYGLRNLFQVGLLAESGLSDAAIASKLGMSSYVVSITKKDMSAKSSYVLNLLNQLATLDQDVKMGKVDRFIAFELFMLDVIRS